MGEGFQGRRFFSPMGLLAAAILVFHSTSVFAQRPPTVPINLNYFRIDFIQPGARPAGLGGAFIGAAQDETAGLINPAGLIYIKRAGVSVHLRAFKLNGRFDSDQFLIAAFFPIKKITVGFFRQGLFNTRFNFETRQFLNIDSNLSPRQVLGGLGNFPGKSVALDLQLSKDRWSLAYKVSERVRFGFTASNFTLDFKMMEQTFLDPLVADGRAPRGNLAETNYSNTTLDHRDGLVWGYSFGLMATILRDKLFFGSVVDFNPNFTLESTIFLPEYRFGQQSLPAESPENTRFILSIPDSYGFGLYYRANSRLNITFDIVRREYSDLLSGNNLNAVEDDEFSDQKNTFTDPDGRPDLTVADATEIHLGVERLFNVSKLGLIPLRFGVYTDPTHRIHAVENDPNLRTLYPQGKTRGFFTFGTGIVGSYYKYDISTNVSADGWQLFFSATFTIPGY